MITQFKQFKDFYKWNKVDTEKNEKAQSKFTIRTYIVYNNLLNRIKKEIIKYIKQQQIPKSDEFHRIKTSFVCQYCRDNRYPYHGMDVGFSESTMNIVIMCRYCRRLVTEINLYQAQNNWIVDFFNITEKDLIEEKLERKSKDDGNKILSTMRTG